MCSVTIQVQGTSNEKHRKISENFPSASALRSWLRDHNLTLLSEPSYFNDESGEEVPVTTEEQWALAAGEQRQVRVEAKGGGSEVARMVDDPEDSRGSDKAYRPGIDTSGNKSALLPDPVFITRPGMALDASGRLGSSGKLEGSGRLDGSGRLRDANDWRKEASGPVAKAPAWSTGSGDSVHPLRPGNEDCKHYMRTGTCKYGATCKFNHPGGTPVGDQRPFVAIPRDVKSPAVNMGAVSTPEPLPLPVGDGPIEGLDEAVVAEVPLVLNKPAAEVDKIVKAFNGKHGCEVARNSGPVKAPIRTGELVVTVNGHFDEIRSLFTDIASSLRQTETKAELSVLTPSTLAGPVIGVKGRQLRDTQLRSGTTLTFTADRDAVGLDFRRLDIAGTPAQVAVAVVLTAAVVERARARPRKDDHVFAFPLLRQYVGLVLGKKGATKKNIEDQTNTVIAIATDDPTALTQELTITGSDAAKVREAQTMVMNLTNAVMARELHATPSTGCNPDGVVVTKDDTGYIVGSKGATIQGFSRKSGAKVELTKEEVEPGLFLVDIKGDPASVAHARGLVLQAVAMLRVKEQSKPGSPGWASSSRGAEGLPRSPRPGSVTSPVNTNDRSFPMMATPRDEHPETPPGLFDDEPHQAFPPPADAAALFAPPTSNSPYVYAPQPPSPLAYFGVSAPASLPPYAQPSTPLYTQPTSFPQVVPQMYPSRPDETNPAAAAAAAAAATSVARPPVTITRPSGSPATPSSPKAAPPPYTSSQMSYAAKAAQPTVYNPAAAPYKPPQFEGHASVPFAWQYDQHLHDMPAWGAAQDVVRQGSGRGLPGGILDTPADPWGNAAGRGRGGSGGVGGGRGARGGRGGGRAVAGAPPQMNLDHYYAAAEAVLREELVKNAGPLQLTYLSKRIQFPNKKVAGTSLQDFLRARGDTFALFDEGCPWVAVSLR